MDAATTLIENRRLRPSQLLNKLKSILSISWMTHNDLLGAGLYSPMRGSTQ
jgi:hypothetical protein